MKVISKPGTKCPKEGKPRDYIGDDAPVEVPSTVFYRRLVRDGSLIVVEEQPVSSPYQWGAGEVLKEKKPKKIKEEVTEI